MLDCSLFEGNVSGDPELPTCLRRNYGNIVDFKYGDPQPPEFNNTEVEITDTPQKDANLLCYDVNGREIKKLEAALLSYPTARQPAPYPGDQSSKTDYGVLYNDQVIGNYKVVFETITSIVDTAGPDGYTGYGDANDIVPGSDIDETDLSWNDELNSPFLSLISSDIVYSINYDVTQPYDYENTVVDSLALSNSIVTYWGKLSVGTNTSVTWRLGNNMHPISTSISYNSNTVSLDLKTDLDNIPNVGATPLTHRETCEAIKQNILNLRWTITEYDENSIEVGTSEPPVYDERVVGYVSYLVKLVEI